MVEEHAIALGDCRRAADDVDDGDVLGESAGKGVESGQLADPECGDDGRETLDAGVAVGGVAWKSMNISATNLLGYPVRRSCLPPLSSFTLPTHLSPFAGR